MALWQKLWLLFTVIWVVVAGLNVATIVAFADGEVEQQRALVPLAFALLVPAAAYGACWLWFRWRRR
jgi:hypothetical protein